MSGINNIDTINDQRLLSLASQEQVRCEQAWTACPDAEWAWCCHHALHVEPMLRSYQGRISYIFENKQMHELPARYRNFRPVRVQLPVALVETFSGSKSEIVPCYLFEEMIRDYEPQLIRDYEQQLRVLHDQDWPDNSWDGTNIFKKYV